MHFHHTKSSPKQVKRQSLGRIYTTKRQPLSQIVHYPKSVLIDEYFLLHNTLTKQASSERQKKSQKVIKFIGTQQENIEQIIKSMDSLSHCENRIFMSVQRMNVEQQIMQILKIFYSKIDKLRMQRQSYKLAYSTQKQLSKKMQDELNQQIGKLTQQLLQLRKQNETLMGNYQNEQKKRLFYQRECMMLQQRVKLNSNINNHTVAESFDLVNRSVNVDDNFFIDSAINENSYSRQFNQNHHHKRFSSNNNHINMYTEENQQQPSIQLIVNKSIHNSRKRNNKLMTYQSQNQSNLIETQTQEEKNKITPEQKLKLQSLLKKHNLQPHQLGDIIEEYLKDLKQQYQKQFENQEEKRLFLLAKKMDAKIWNKKVKKDIEKIITSKESIKFKD